MEVDDKVGETEAVTARELVVILRRYHSAIAGWHAGAHGTKSDLMQTKIDLLEATSRLDLSIANFRTDMQSLETRLLKWFVGTAGALSAIAFGVARLVH